MKKTTESDLVKVLLDYLRLRGLFCWRANTTGVRRTDRKGRSFWSFNGTRGVSDILCVLPPRGRLLAIEAKAPDGQATQDQLVFGAAVSDAGGLYFVVRSLDDLRELMEEHGL